jgi:LysM repeat protein
MPSTSLLARAAVDGESDVVPAAADAAITGQSERTRVVYRVRRGDSLYSIARKHGTTIDRLKAWNNLRGNVISIGTRLVILSGRDANAQQ